MLERDNTGKITLRGQDSFWLFFSEILWTLSKLFNLWNTIVYAWKASTNVFKESGLNVIYEQLILKSILKHLNLIWVTDYSTNHYFLRSTQRSVFSYCLTNQTMCSLLFITKEALMGKILEPGTTLNEPNTVKVSIERI